MNQRMTALLCFMVVGLCFILSRFLPKESSSEPKRAVELKASQNDKPNRTRKADVRLKEALPWKGDASFMKMQKANETPVLMAQYEASLPDPILNERHNIALGAEYLKGQVISPGSVFSLNTRLGRRTKARGFKEGPMYMGNQIVPTVGGGVCKIASFMYNLAILSNQEVLERHGHGMTVPYVPAGQDATVSYPDKDFKFRNISKGSIMIWGQETGGTLYMALYGREKPPIVQWEHKVLKRYANKTTYVKDDDLSKGEEKIVHEGSEGLDVHSWIVVRQLDGEIVKKDLGISSYKPGPKVIAVGR